MRLPRDLDADDLIKAFERLGYRPSNMTGSHMRLTTSVHGEHHITIPHHSPLRIGTLNAILRDVENHFSISREEILKIFLKG